MIGFQPVSFRLEQRFPLGAKEAGLTSGPALWPPETGWKPMYVRFFVRRSSRKEAFL
jgi:hypothetical protein